MCVDADGEVGGTTIVCEGVDCGEILLQMLGRAEGHAACEDGEDAREDEDGEPVCVDRGGGLWCVSLAMMEMATGSYVC